MPSPGAVQLEANGLKRRRFITLGAACLAAVSAGTPYVCSSYAPQIALRLGLSAKETNVMLMSANSGGYLAGPFTGYFVDRRGPRSTLLIGATLVSAGYYTLKVFYDDGPTGLYSAFGLLPIALCEFFVGVGSSAAYAGFSNGVANAFSPKRRATALSLCIACLGLSAFVYSTLASSYLGTHLIPGIDSTSAFLSLLAFGTGGSIVIASFGIQSRRASRRSTENSYMALPSSAAHPEIAKSDERGQEGSAHLRVPSVRSISSSESSTPESVHGADYLEVERARSESRPRGLMIEENGLSGFALLNSIDFWALFLFFGLLAGCGLMYINNVGMVLLALPSQSPELLTVPLKDLQHRLVALISIFSCLGRICYGPISDYLRQHPRYLLDRTWYCLPIALAFLIANLWVGSVDRRDGWYGLQGPTILIGFSYGSLAGSMPVLVIEWFGLESFSTNNGLLGLSPAISGNAMNLLFGAIYDAQSARPSSSSLRARAEVDSAKPLCTLGKECFHEAFRIATILSCLALALSIWMGFRRSKFTSDQRERLEEGRDLRE